MADDLAPVLEDRALEASTRYNLTSKEIRNQLVAIYCKLKAEGLWPLVGHIRWFAGAGGAFTFEPTMSQAHLQQYLRAHGYGTWWMAATGGEWGLRSRATGAQLHFRGGTVPSVHIDLNNPGEEGGTWLALSHYLNDSSSREETHTSVNLRDALGTQGIVVPWLP